MQALTRGVYAALPVHSLTGVDARCADEVYSRCTPSARCHVCGSFSRSVGRSRRSRETCEVKVPMLGQLGPRTTWREEYFPSKSRSVGNIKL